MSTLFIAKLPIARYWELSKINSMYCLTAANGKNIHQKQRMWNGKAPESGKILECLQQVVTQDGILLGGGVGNHVTK
jgi:hypothetical protein